MPYFTDEDARSLIRTTYEAAAPAGSEVARSLYDPAELAGVPDGAISWALGVGNPVRHARLRPEDVVLDVGCGAGLDTLIAATRVPAGRVIGLDMTPAMLDRARGYAALMRIEHVEWREGLMEALPLPDAAVDVVLCNGVLNLSTRKSRALAEMGRVLRPGGRLALADLVLTDSLPEEILRDATALSVWLAGALAEPVLSRKLRNVGFEGLVVHARRPFGLGALTRYQLFPPEFLDFVRRVVPADRHDTLVHAIDLTATVST